MKREFGEKSRISLSYDLTFLGLLLSSLYEEDKKEKFVCFLHPFIKREALSGEAFSYCANMNVILTHEKCKDDFLDERKKLNYIYGKILVVNKKDIFKSQEKKIKVIKKSLKEMRLLEKKEVFDPENMAKIFGKAFGEVFVYKDDIWAKYLRTMGDYLGRYIYILDAYDDIEEDEKNNRYNPFHELKNDNDFDEKVYKMLFENISKSARAFECLPIIENIDILRNILYSGVWADYEKIKMGGKRDGSIRNSWCEQRCNR